MSAADIQSIINTLSEKLGPVGKIAWEAYVRQRYVIGYTQLAFAILLAIFASIASKFAWDMYSNPEHEDDDGAIVFFSGLVAVVCLIVMVGLVTDGVGHIVNPSYGAIQGLLGR